MASVPARPHCRDQRSDVSRISRRRTGVVRQLTCDAVPPLGRDRAGDRGVAGQPPTRRRELHRLTRGWPQRPGWRSSTDLLHAETGTRIDLGAMPPESVARCRAAWARLTGRQTCVVHGNPNNPGNVRMTASRVALIDWDESHVDVPDLDLVLPGNAADLDDGALDIAGQASAAWEAAVCWDDEYAVRRLAEVRAV
ncbi:phosphotransferase [Micromonospora sp. CPCC 205546]|uniref:phosphotransferase n=1 Tax=Micromonospora sp. CPCC 205546 TaxID=3122397 RepID=UPI002FF2922F